MARQAVKEAVESRLDANWTLCPVVVGNVDTQGPADGSTYLAVEYPVANEKQITIGAPGHNVWREAGAFRLVLSVRTGDPLDEATTWLDQARAIFRGKQFAGVTCYAPSPATEDNSSYVNNARVLLSSAVPYQFDFLA